MNKITDADLVVSKQGISYFIIHNESATCSRSYGILAKMSDDEADFEMAENLFFTRAEAEAYCKYFADNEVYPVSLCEVLGNIYHI